MLEVYWSLVLGWQHEYGEDELIPCVSTVPVFPENRKVATLEVEVDLCFLLVLAAEADVEEDEQQGHQGSGTDADVEPGVVVEDFLLVVIRIIVKVMSVNSRLQG